LEVSLNKPSSRPLVIGRPNPVDPQRFADLVQQVWDSGHYTNFGPKEREFSVRLCKRLRVSETMLFTNGHLALEAMLHGLGQRGEIITSPYTFASTAQAILNLGFTPVFADIEPDGVNIDPDKVEEKITSKTRAILGVHVFGVPCQDARLRKLADQHGLALLYDAAHTFGAELDGGSLAGLGDASILSLHATKIFHSIEGGALVINSDRLDPALLRGYRNFGYVEDGVIASQGSNGKMSELHAAVGIANLETFDAELAGRRLVAQKLRVALGKTPCFDFLSEGISGNDSYFPIFLRGKSEQLIIARPRILDQLRAEGIFARPYFWPALTDTPVFRPYIQGGECAHATRRALTSLCLPVLSDFNEDDIARLAEAVLRICEAHLPDQRGI
jgi:dTDP-4-amino-4,6-dideoxygalactose transaminase